MTYKEIIREIDSVKTAIEKTFAECMNLGEHHKFGNFKVDMSEICSPCDKEGQGCCVEDAWCLGHISIILKDPEMIPLHGLSRFLSLVYPPRQIPSVSGEFVLETMIIDKDDITIYLDAERMFEIFGGMTENP